MTKKTKIVATIGPATESESIIEELINAGMNVARFNTKHNEPAWHSQVMERVQSVSDRIKTPVATLLDLQGPEIRINLPREESFSVHIGEDVIFTSDTNYDAQHYVMVPQDVITSLTAGNDILLEDGACEFTVTEVADTHLIAQATVNCEVKHRKTMNTPGVVLNMPSLTERDYEYLDGVRHELIDYVGLSFVRNAQDIAILKEELQKRNIDAHIVAKIENQEALNNIEEIIDSADAVMVARGDLGVEVAYEELIYWQRKIIDLSRDKAKPVITATQMLSSMVDKPRPTRAEVSDVAHAIYDHTDAVMLSEETTIGQYPVKAVKVQATISQFNEQHVPEQDLGKKLTNTTTSTAISHAAMGLINDSDFQIDRVICLTETGFTAKLLSRFRPNVPVEAVTSSPHIMRRLALLYGVTSHVIDLPESKLEDVDSMVEKFEEAGIVKKGESIMIIHGTLWKRPGLTNTLTLVTIK